MNTILFVDGNSQEIPGESCEVSGGAASTLQKSKMASDTSCVPVSMVTVSSQQDGGRFSD